MPELSIPAIPDDAPGGVLTVDLDAICANYALLREKAAQAETAAVVKANAYGTGLEPVAKALADAGCRTFFVALAHEGARLRKVLPDVTIYVLCGLMPGSADYYLAHDLCPSLTTLSEVIEWRDAAARQGRKLKAGLHFDTGLNRLGMTPENAVALAADGALSEGLDVTLIMSHLACADTPDHPHNAMQLSRFREICGLLNERFPHAKASLANSGGVMMGLDYHFDLVRPGIALYGGNPQDAGKTPFHPVVKVEVPVLVIREMREGETAGYGATWRAGRPARVAVISTGYADGYMRALGYPRSGIFDNNGQERPDDSLDGAGGRVRIAGYTAPVAGRISMDTTIVDISALPENAVKRGDMAELLCPDITVDELARRAGTIGYEILTSLGNRYRRVYKSGNM